MTIQSPIASESYPHGYDYEWFACDKSEHISVFTSAGIGPIPTSVLVSRMQTDSLAEVVWKMPARGIATMMVNYPRPDDFLHYAKCGFYAYDWRDVHRTESFSRHYEIISKPEKPIRLSELPDIFQLLLQNTKFQDINFSDINSIDIRKYFDCRP
jgi:hypothetical protein